MAAGDADSGYGVAITFQSGIMASLRNVSFTQSREVIDTSHATSTNGWKTFIASGFQDAGEVTAELIHDNTATWKTALTAVAETVTVTLPNNGSTAQTVACSGFLTEIGVDIPAGPDDDVIMNNVTIKLTGEPTWTAAT